MSGYKDSELHPEDQALPRLRPELKVSEHIYDGQPFWVLKDPIGLRYYRFNREEYFIVDQLGKGTTLRKLKETHRKEFGSDILQNAEISTFVTDLATRNLLVMGQDNRDELLYDWSEKRRKMKLKGQMTSLMYIKFPLIDPDKILDRMMPYISFIWTWSFLLFFTCFVGLGIWLVLDRWGDFAEMTRTGLLTIYNVPVIFASLWLIKCLHEFGHGLTCKKFGGEVHEIGIMFLVFAPFLYCNVTDSWSFPSKAHRLLVTAGGVLTEILVACVACVVWYFTEQPSFIHTLAFNLIIVGSFSTIMFNMNPLLRFDGYYFMMDLIEVPNLRQRSSEYLGSLFVRLLGGRTESLPEDHKYRMVFPMYSTLAFIYRWFIVFSILGIVYHMLEQVHLVWLGRILLVGLGGMMLLLPLYKTANKVIRRRRAYAFSTARLTIFMALIVALIGVILFMPLEQEVTLPFILEPEQIQYLRSEVPGNLTWCSGVTEGLWVSPDDASGGVVAGLDNIKLAYERTALDASIAQTEIDIKRYQQQGLTTLVEQYRERLGAARRERTRLGELQEALKPRVEFRGEILSDTRSLKKGQGRFVNIGEPLLLLADTRKMAAKVWVPESMLGRIFHQPNQYGQAAELMLYAFSKDKFTGEVVSLGQHAEDDMGEFGEKMALSNKVGGEVLTERDQELGRERPQEAVYEVVIRLNQESLPDSARAYMSGRVHIACGESTLYSWFRDSVLRFISPEVRL